MDAVALDSGGADAMGASGVTTVAVLVVMVAVVTMTMTGPTMTATSPARDSSRSNVVGGASCDTGGVWNAEGVSYGIWGGWIIPRLRV